MHHSRFGFDCRVLCLKMKSIKYEFVKRQYKNKIKVSIQTLSKIKLIRGSGLVNA